MHEKVPIIAVQSRNSWGEAPRKRRNSNSLRYNYICLCARAARVVRAGEKLRSVNEDGPMAVREVRCVISPSAALGLGACL